MLLSAFLVYILGYPFWVGLGVKPSKETPGLGPLVNLKLPFIPPDFGEIIQRCEF